jgi:hypothetical protein
MDHVKIPTGAEIPRIRPEPIERGGEKQKQPGFISSCILALKLWLYGDGR